MIGYYDYVLGLIPTVLLGVTLVLAVLGIPLEAAVPVGGGASALVVGHAMFVRGPVDEAPAAGDAPDVAATSGPAPGAD